MQKLDCCGRHSLPFLLSEVSGRIGEVDAITGDLPILSHNARDITPAVVVSWAGTIATVGTRLTLWQDLGNLGSKVSRSLIEIVRILCTTDCNAR